MDTSIAGLAADADTKQRTQTPTVIPPPLPKVHNLRLSRKLEKRFWRSFTSMIQWLGPEAFQLTLAAALAVAGALLGLYSPMVFGEFWDAFSKKASDVVC